jgi:hypothetical protein
VSGALIVSPLLALVRKQIAAAERLGIRAHTINSTNRDAWDEVRALLAEGSVDLLSISPEGLNNPKFREEMLPLFVERVGLLVLDETHCISDWGHDFRPDYRRSAEMLERPPAGVAVLCTTSTANDRVVADVADQLRVGHAGEAAHVSGAVGAVEPAAGGGRSPGARRAARVVGDLAAAARGLRIVYTLTKRDVELVAEWLTAHGISAEAYSGEVPNPTGGWRSRSGCWPMTSRRSSPPARSGWATTSLISGSWCNAARAFSSRNDRQAGEASRADLLEVARPHERDELGRLAVELLPARYWGRKRGERSRGVLRRDLVHRGR